MLMFCISRLALWAAARRKSDQIARSCRPTHEKPRISAGLSLLRRRPLDSQAGRQVRGDANDGDASRARRASRRRPTFPLSNRRAIWAPNSVGVRRSPMPNALVFNPSGRGRRVSLIMGFGVSARDGVASHVPAHDHVSGPEVEKPAIPKGQGASPGPGKRQGRGRTRLPAMVAIPWRKRRRGRKSLDTECFSEERHRSCFDRSQYCLSRSSCSLPHRIWQRRRGSASGDIFTMAEANFTAIESVRK